MRRNLIGVGGATWDATLLGAGHSNGYLQISGNFSDPLQGNYTLPSTHPDKGTAFGSNRDPGYDHDYMVAMTSTVRSNAEG